MQAVNFKEIRVALARMIEGATGLTAILDEQKGRTNTTQKLPDLPFFSFKIATGAQKKGDDDYRYSRTDVTDPENPVTTFNSGGQRMMSVSFQVYTDEQECANAYMATLQSSLELRGVQESLRDKGIAVWNIGTIADLSQLLNTGYEARAHMDVEFGIAANLEETLKTIDAVEVEGTVNSVVETFSIPEEET